MGRQALKWISVSSVSMPDPRLPRHRSNHLRCIVVTQLLDSRGLHWERYADEPPVCLGPPPEDFSIVDRPKPKPSP